MYNTSLTVIKPKYCIGIDPCNGSDSFVRFKINKGIAEYDTRKHDEDFDKLVETILCIKTD